MSRFAPEEKDLQRLDGKVIVLTGGANGIGAATVFLLYKAGASIVFGDWDATAGEKVVASLKDNEKSSSTSNGHPSKQRVHFLRTDVTKYEDNLALFDLALKEYGKVDHAMSIAGIVEQGNWFDANLTTESVKKQPPTTALDVNLLGVLYFARIAIVYLRENRKEGEDRSLLLFSSVAGFKETPGLFVYQAAKHGVLGLMRSLRPYLPEACNIRVNAICPWMTATQLAAGIEDDWYAAKLPVNQPVDVAKVNVDVTRMKGLHGKAFYIEGGRAWEVEDIINRLEPQWLGEKQSRDLQRGQDTLGNVGT
ncbi:hypothetical protein MMC25_007994 [Agyrium rufum]|nr:hypothetical protein [Agyrium rufum]